MLIVRAHSNSGVACEINHTCDDRLLPVHFRRSTGRALAGDRVRVDRDGAVTEILPRKNQFGRGAWKGGFQPIAANLDWLVVVLAAQPAPSRDLLQRYLAAAHILDLTPCLVLNKSDLPDTSLPVDLTACQQAQVPVLNVSASTGLGLDALRAMLDGKLSILAGQSGVGKTSLANALIPGLDRKTALLSSVTGKGTHTTSVCELHRLPGGGWLGDSPGVWEYHLWKMPPRELERGFPDIAARSARCRFNDCRHVGEPGCYVVESGELTPPRIDVWRRLLRETS